VAARLLPASLLRRRPRPVSVPAVQRHEPPPQPARRGGLWAIAEAQRCAMNAHPTGRHGNVPPNHPPQQINRHLGPKRWPSCGRTPGPLAEGASRKPTGVVQQTTVSKSDHARLGWRGPICRGTNWAKR
jgi:hypothetical protein